MKREMCSFSAGADVMANPQQDVLRHHHAMLMASLMFLTQMHNLARHPGLTGLLQAVKKKDIIEI